MNFKFKSTAPVVVGGDNWGTEVSLGLAKPLRPAEGAKPEDIANYTDTRTAFDAALEAARGRVDRMACCGKIPAVLAGDIAAGDLVIPLQSGSGIAAGGLSLAAATFDQYKNRIGRVLVAHPTGDQFKALLGPDFTVDPAWNAIIDV